MQEDIVDTKNAYHQCRVDILNARNARPATYDKDTHVNLDMQMWITHNQTKVDYTTKKPYATKAEWPDIVVAILAIYI